MTAELYQAFRDPGREYSPVPIWWWSAEKLDPARLRWQLERFAEGGVYNLIVLNLAPTSPLYGSDADDPPFFSDAWWSIFEGACEDARALGVRLWFYDQIGFSGANLQGEIVKERPEFAGQAIERLEMTMSEAGELHCPAGGEPVAASATPLDAAGNAAGTPVALPVDGGGVRSTGGAAHRLSLYYTVTRGFDYHSAAACQMLMQTVHSAFERHVGQHFGTTIAGSFQDELPAMPTWSREFAQEFRGRRGYDLLPKLAALWEEYGPEAERIRRDYQATRAELAEDAFFKSLHAWHEERGLLCGFDQQGPARAGFPLQTVSLYADYQRTHRWFTAPGSDHHGEAKIHSSLAHLYGRPRVWIESFHSSGWGGTIEETFDWLLPWLRAGANLYDPHAVYYSTRGGWWEWAPPSTDWRQPYWKHYRPFATAVSRLCAMLSQGQHVCDMGMLFPNSTIQAGTTLAGPTAEARAAHDTYLALVGKMLWYDVQEGVLDQARTDYDVLDDDSLQRAAVEDGALQVAGERFTTIILPGCAVLESATARRLVEFVDGGGRLIAVGALPRVAAGVGGDDDPVRELATLFERRRAHHVETAETLPSILANTPVRVGAPVPTLVRRVGDATVVFVPAAFPRATEMNRSTEQDALFEWLEAGYTFDPAKYHQSLSIKVRGVAGVPEIWAPYSGERRVADYTTHETSDGLVTEVDVRFSDAPGVLVVWPEPIGEQAAAASRPDGTEITVLAEQALDGPWDVEVVRTLDNKWGDFALPADTEGVPVEHWSVRHAVEDGRDGLEEGWHRPDYDDSAWDTAHATFGPRGLWAGPTLPKDLPGPGETAGDWWEARYSLSHGIYKDRIHRRTLGPKGHVPEEFLDFGPVPPGEAVQFRATIPLASPLDCHLALGAAARKTVWLNGEELPVSPGGYLAMYPVALRAGDNTLEFRLQAETTANLRAYYALVQNPDRYARPEWIAPDDEGLKDSVVSFARSFTLQAPPDRATLQLGGITPCHLFVNGVEAGVQGGFDPYADRRVARLQRYDITTYLQSGENRLEVRASDRGFSVAALVDAIIEVGGDRVAFFTDAGWMVSRDGDPRALRLHSQQLGEGDPSHSHLWRRPHPLPHAAWLEGPQDGTVVPITPTARPDTGRVEWIRFLVAPGATLMRLPMHGEVRVWVGGDSVLESSATGGQPLEVPLPEPSAPRRVCAIRVNTIPGHQGGGIFAGPITYEMGPGVMMAGNWEELGLAGFSGGVRYRRTITGDGRDQSSRVLLDLGRVRGTAQVRVNGESSGVRLWSPYTYDLTTQLRDGPNELEVEVYNTLGPYLEAVSPTHMVFPGQTISGLLGPVRLRVVRDGPPTT